MQVVAEGLDAVRLLFLRAVLADAGIAAVLLDANTAALGLGVVPARLAVAEADAARARRILADADG
ncbi:putative signal transducing protein [Roseococcus sp. DSY-14]|uniref:putative signal transducing protein n=1 Tax=Roseococcus sp. DSY-14 TaxID=3369650 RepID=UPI00387B0C46